MRGPNVGEADGLGFGSGSFHLEYEHVLCGGIREQRIGNIISNDGVEDGVVYIQEQGQFLVAKQGGGICGQKLEELGLVLALLTRAHHLPTLYHNATLKTGQRRQDRQVPGQKQLKPQQRTKSQTKQSLFGTLPKSANGNTTANEHKRGRQTQTRSEPEQQVTSGDETTEEGQNTNGVSNLSSLLLRELGPGGSEETTPLTRSPPDIQSAPIRSIQIRIDSLPL